MEAGIPCAVPVGTIYPRCLPSAARLSERDLTGYTNNRVPDHIKELRARLDPPEALSAVANRSTRAGLSPAGYGGLCTHSPFPESPPLGRSVAPMSLDGEEILTNEFENDDFPGSSSYEPRSAQLSSGSHRARRATAVEGVGTLPSYGQRYDHDDRALHDRVAALEQRQSAEIATLGQEVRVLRADVGQAAQTASDLSIGLGTRLNVMRELEEAFVASQASHQP
ncbi:hypothetical protein V7S43_007615 [Phytophthora oleae]|uniref:Uncharacterized protein n=1 Tax=Phytophthora oleae TaxID=2107226 RepID=A0ABD3FP53_9STRA